MKMFLIIIGIIVSPIFVYFCVKFGTIGYYKAKQFIEREKPCCDDPSEDKCDQCQETGIANPDNH